MQPRHVQCLHQIRTYPLEIRKYNRSESSDKNHSCYEGHEGWKEILEKCKRKTVSSNCNLLLENRKSCLEFWEHTIYSTNFFQFQSCDRWTHYHGEPEKKLWTSQQGTENSIFRVTFRIRFKVITTMISKITSFIADFFKIQSCYSPTPTHGEPEKKICWTSQQGTKHSIFRDIFRIRF